MSQPSVLRSVTCLALAAPLSLLAASPAAASCAASEAAVSPGSAAPGQALVVSSSNWFGICNDTGQKVDPTDRAVVTFVQGTSRVVLGRTNSNAQGVFQLTVRVPRQAAEGAAVLEVRGRSAADDVPLSVKAGTLPLTGPGRVKPWGLGLLLTALGAVAVKRGVAADR